MTRRIVSGWRQCRDVRTGELYYRCDSCGIVEGDPHREGCITRRGEKVGMITQHKRRISIVTIAALLLICMCLAMVATATVSGLASYGVGFWSLSQYAQHTNEYIDYLEETCVKKPEMRRGKSHNKPEWTGY